MPAYWSAFVIPIQETFRRILAFMPRFLVALLLFLLFYGLAVLVRWGIRRALQRLPQLPPTLGILMARSVYILTLLVGMLVALTAANLNVIAVLEGVGIAGIALGFALKDILENVISGILLLFARPFEVGDQVVLGNYEGTVTDIQIRTTTLQTYAEERVAIPNSQIYTNPVINLTAQGRRRYMVAFDTSLTADAQRVEQEALAAATEQSEVLPDPAPFVRMVKVESGNDVLSWCLFYWAAPTKAVEVKTISEILQRLKARLYDAGVPTPTPTSATIVQYRGAAPKETHSDYSQHAS